MTDMTTTHSPKLEHSDTSPVTSATSSTETQALITEQQVLFSTAAAVALRPAKTQRWSDTIQAVSTALRAMFAASEKRLRDGITRSGTSGWTTRSCRAKWIGSERDQLASGMGLTTSE